MIEIKKAVIAAGGWSTRFLPAVKTYAKQLAPILEKPQIQWVMEELVEAGIDEIAIVHRDGESSLLNHFTEDKSLSEYLEKSGKQACMESWWNLKNKLKRLEFFPQTSKFPYGNGTPAIICEEFLEGQSFTYLYGDDLIVEDNQGEYVKHLIDVYNRYNCKVVAASQRVPHDQIYKYGSVKYHQGGDIPYRMETVIEKPKVEEAPSDDIIFGRFILSPEIIDVLKHTAIDRGELWLTNAVNATAVSGEVVVAEPTSCTGATWITTGDPDNWLKANILMALKSDRFRDSIRKFLLDNVDVIRRN